MKRVEINSLIGTLGLGTVLADLLQVAGGLLMTTALQNIVNSEKIVAEL